MNRLNQTVHQALKPIKAGSGSVMMMLSKKFYLLIHTMMFKHLLFLFASAVKARATSIKYP